ncbi:MAG: histidine phosphatase family protein [Bdellovibrionales bacterium]|nr:histidine phosphatase family protein [Bdellovibrionales bacterium]
MLTLILLRHGQTQWNKDGRVMSRLDIPLNDTGQKQVQVSAEKLKAYPVSKIISSPQLRALETAQPIATRLNLPIGIEERLSEMRFDRWEGKDFNEIKGDPVYKERRQNPFMKPHPEVETVLELFERTKHLLTELVKEQGCIVCVSHMDVLKAMMCQMVPVPIEEFFTFEIENATPKVFTFENNKWLQTTI